ncbi:hypothetical protein JW897_17730 [Chromobacterium alkanivorans]|uniref:hypothetical protein n=1 Tax=Chromobacterium alkanivorans TaxID=1071719 RepID=UPI00196886ED|nr:hypothetical protein [Chromobacterium alkanivorans]MBN3005576.1 hypothetical protein [Chromobacterium alkanivorans]
MKLDQLQYLPLADGDLLKMPADTDPDTLRQLAEAIARLHPGKQILIIARDIRKLTDEELALAGLERKKA